MPRHSLVWFNFIFLVVFIFSPSLYFSSFVRYSLPFVYSLGNLLLGLRLSVSIKSIYFYCIYYSAFLFSAINASINGFRFPLIYGFFILTLPIMLHYVLSFTLFFRAQQVSNLLVQKLSLLLITAYYIVFYSSLSQLWQMKVFTETEYGFGDIYSFQSVITELSLMGSNGISLWVSSSSFTVILFNYLFLNRFKINSFFRFFIPLASTSTCLTSTFIAITYNSRSQIASSIWLLAISIVFLVKPLIPRKFLHTSFTLLLPAALTAFVSYLFTSDSLSSNQVITNLLEKESTGDSRLSAISVFVEKLLFTFNGWFGYGFDTQPLNELVGILPHNTFIYLGLCFGLIGFTSIFVFLSFLFIKNIALLRLQALLFLLASVLYIGFICFITHNFLLYFYTLCALVFFLNFHQKRFY